MEPTEPIVLPDAAVAEEVSCDSERSKKRKRADAEKSEAIDLTVEPDQRTPPARLLLPRPLGGYAKGGRGLGFAHQAAAELVRRATEHEAARLDRSGRVDPISPPFEKRVRFNNAEEQLIDRMAKYDFGPGILRPIWSQVIVALENFFEPVRNLIPFKMLSDSVREEIVREHRCKEVFTQRHLVGDRDADTRLEFFKIVEANNYSILELFNLLNTVEAIDGVLADSFVKRRTSENKCRLIAMTDDYAIVETLEHDKLYRHYD